MSVNNFQPQYATTTTGQVYMLQPHHQLGVSYFVHRPYINIAQQPHHPAGQLQQLPQLPQPGALQAGSPVAAAAAAAAAGQHVAAPQHQLLHHHHQQQQQQQQQQQLTQLPPPGALQAGSPVGTAAGAGQHVAAPHHQLHHHHQLSPPRSLAATQTKDQTNARIKSIKDKCSVTHYIDGQMIMETLKPLGEKKAKKKKPPAILQQQQQQQQQHQQLQQQQQQQHQQHQQNQPQQQHQHHQQQQHATTAAAASIAPANQQLHQLHHQHLQPATLQAPPPHPPPPPPHPPQQNNHSPTQNGNSDIRKLRAQMPNWSVAEVVNFIESHEDIKQYSAKFAEDEVDGKALLLMIDRNLNFQILTTMFKHGPAFKIEATLSKYKLND